MRLHACNDESHVRDLMALRIMHAVAEGESDPKRLKEIALRAIGERGTRCETYATTLSTWLRHAEQAWLVSTTLSDEEARSKMIRIAQSYELLAKHALEGTETHKKKE